MKILALDGSAAAGSAAVCEEDRVIGESFLHTAKTHSQTLLPMTTELLELSDTKLSDLDFLAVTVGPGSFTGLRIAISAVKGMAMGADKACVGVSTLESLAYNLRGFEGVVASVMDARCEQVYTALFALHDGAVARTTPDMAISISELSKMLQNEKKAIFLVGDGAIMCYTKLSDEHPTLRLAPAPLRYARASSVAACAYNKYLLEGTIPAEALLPSYLRLPQAERELLCRS